jgi:hypothetical protein
MLPFLLALIYFQYRKPITGARREHSVRALRVGKVLRVYLYHHKIYGNPFGRR